MKPRRQAPSFLGTFAPQGGSSPDAVTVGAADGVSPMAASVGLPAGGAASGLEPSPPTPLQAARTTKANATPSALMPPSIFPRLPVATSISKDEEGLNLLHGRLQAAEDAGYPRPSVSVGRSRRLAPSPVTDPQGNDDKSDGDVYRQDGD